MSLYSPLPDGGVRLLRLLPHSDEHPGIRCDLFTCILLNSGKGHRYEALSYVWGRPESGQQVIHINGRPVSVRGNLHAALRELQDLFVERVLWVDAICINQEDIDEKGQQVQHIAKIYAKASGVVVWLGEAAGDSDRALEAILAASRAQHAIATVDALSQQAPAETGAQEATDQDAVFTLLERPWFQRIWVLQEVAAARKILIKCGPSEIDGYIFCSGLSALKLPYQTRPHLRSSIPPTLSLIKSAAFRPKFEKLDVGPSDRFSLCVRPLAELIDMYHTRKATHHVDKIYGLLGMISDDPGTLSVSYDKPWGVVFGELVQSLLSTHVSVRAWDGVEVAVLEAKGYVLGEVSSVGSDINQDDNQNNGDITQNDGQVVKVTWSSDVPGYDDGRKYSNEKQSSHFALPSLAKTVQVGDIVCLLQGASNPTLVRLHSDFSTVIAIMLPLKGPVQNWAASIKDFPHDLLLVWDWNQVQGMPQDGEYADFLSTRGVPECQKAETGRQGHMEKAVRMWNLGLLLNQMEKYPEAWGYLQNAVGVYGTWKEFGETDPTDSDDLAEGDGHEMTRRAMDDLRMRSDGSATEANIKEYSGIPLLWAAATGHKTIVQQLLRKGANINAQDEDGQTSFLWAMERGHETIVQLLLDGGFDINGRNQYGETPLVWAADAGDETVVRLLLDKGADIDAKCRYGQTPLGWAILRRHDEIAQLLFDRNASLENSYERPLLECAVLAGYKAMVQLLLDRGADIQVRSRFAKDTMQGVAASCGHEAVLQVLLDRGADIEAGDNYHRTPLSSAASAGHIAVMRLLLDRGADIETKDGGGKTPLANAAWGGQKAAVQLLLDRGADLEATDEGLNTPLSLVARNGRKEMVELLLDRGANIEGRADRAWTPLAEAASWGKKEVVQVLLDRGADVDARDNSGRTPIVLAADRRWEEVVQLLLDRKAAIDSQRRERGGRV